MALGIVLLAAAVLAVASSAAAAQTTAGIGTTIVFPVTAQTSSFASEVTIYNPGPNPLTAHVTFFEANDSSTPGTKVCTDASVPANRSVQFSIGSQCPLAAGSHFGVLVVSDSANPQSNSFYGYTRVQNPQGIGFSIEGFPIQNFNNQVNHATGLKRQAAAPTYQTNCFVGSLDQPVSYELKLFNDTTGTQIGNALTGSLNTFEQYRYLDVFGPNGVNAPAGDQLNVRAQFTQTSGGAANLIGFCTVQDNTSFGADFRIAKSYGSPSNSFFAQGGNTFGTTARLGTLDAQPLELYVAGGRVMRFEYQSGSPNVVGGYVGNDVGSVGGGRTIAGGGFSDTGCPFGICSNSIVADFASIGGGLGNYARGYGSTIAGGGNNLAGDSTVHIYPYASVGGGYSNTADGSYSAIPGGYQNFAAGATSFAAGNQAKSVRDGEFVWADSVPAPFEPETATHGWGVGAGANTFNARAIGGVWFVTGVDSSHQPTTSVYVAPNSGAWGSTSDRALKKNFRGIDPRDVLQKVVAMPIDTWSYIGENDKVRHLGPVSQDFWAAFGLGPDDRTITNIDSEGVALAAIQGLNQLVQEKDTRIATLEQQVSELQSLRRELAALKAMVAEMAIASESMANRQEDVRFSRYRAQ